MKKYISVLFSLIFIFSFVFPFFSSATSYVLLDKWGYTDPISDKLVTFDSQPLCEAGAKTILINTPTCVNNPTLSNTNTADVNGTYYFNQTMSDGTKQTFSWQTMPLCTAGRAVYIKANPTATLSDCAILNLSTNNDVYTYTPTPTTNTTGSAVYKLLAPIGGLINAPTNIGDYFNILFKIAIGICAVLAVVMIVLGGIQYMGDESIFGKTEAKSQIIKAIFGLLIALGAYALLNTINPALLGTNGVNIAAVSAEVDEEPILSDAGSAVPTKNTFTNCPGGTRVVQTRTSNFIFCSAYATNLQSMVADAYTAGFTLSGGGFRSYDKQVALRTANCPAPILTVPASSCKPPTAIPGTSNHEQGLAVDLKCNGSLINWDSQNKNFTVTASTKACFDWLANAALTEKYGFKNLASENWHWSIGPKAGQ